MGGRAVWRFDAIGTPWEIETSEPLDDARARGGRACSSTRSTREWSRFRRRLAGVARSRAAAAPCPRPATPRAMLDAYAALSDATDGAVNPLVGASLERLGYDAALLARRPRCRPRAGGLARAGSRGATSGSRSPNPRSSTSARSARGRLVDLVMDVVAAAVPGDVVVDASGDLAVRGAPQRIGLEHPFDTAPRDRRVGGDGCRALRVGDEPPRLGRRPPPRARRPHRHAGADDRGDVGGRGLGDARGRARDGAVLRRRPAPRPRVGRASGCG